MNPFARLPKAIFLIAFIFSAASSVVAAEFPSKTIQIINPYPAGAVTDILARLIADKASAKFGQSVIVVNKTGGGGAVGIKAVKAAPADGYSVLIAPPPIALIPLARKDIGFTLDDFTALNLIGRTPAVMIVKGDSPWKTLEDLIADGKKKPGELTFGTPGSGTSGHFTMELFQKETGVKFIHVPLGGEAPVASGIIGGNIHTSIIGLGTARPHLVAGGLRALAVAADKRIDEFPAVPTTFEKGFSAVEASPWFGFFVRNGTDKSVVNKLANGFRDVLEDQELRAKIVKAGVSIDNLGVAEAAQFLAKELKRWTEVAKAAKIN
ncbi:MAG: tripartite tricarboxylate transporter substrate binding protein [Candidatus Binatia bacterium]